MPSSLIPALLVLLVPLLPAQQDAEPSSEQPSTKRRAFIEVEVELAGAEKTSFSYGFAGSEGWTVYLQSTEGRQGLSAVVGGYGRSAGPEGKSGLTVLFFIYFFDNSESLVEVQILNDALTQPAGRIEADYKVTYLGKVLGEGRHAFPDQAGLAFWSGKPRFAPRLDLWTKYTDQLPGAGMITGLPDESAARKADPDPVRDAGAAGGPRNQYVAAEASRYLYTQDGGYLEQLLDFVVAQARRPYHLTGEQGEPFFHSEHPEAAFVNGRPEPLVYQETFGRVALTSAQLDSDGYTGWAADSLDVEELYAAYLLAGSRLARRELVLIAEELLCTDEVREKNHPQGSAQRFGWTARALVRAYQATGERAYMDGVRRMLESLRQRRIVDGPSRALVPQDPDPRYFAAERFERPAMVAVAASAIALYLREARSDADARELLEFCGDLIVDQGFNQDGGGFYEAYSVQSEARAGDGMANAGEVLMIPSALVEIAEFAPDEKREKYLAPARRIFTLNQMQRFGQPSSLEFHRWLLRAAKEFR